MGHAQDASELFLSNAKGSAVSLLGITKGTFDVACLTSPPSDLEALVNQDKRLGDAYYGEWTWSAENSDDDDEDEHDSNLVQAFARAHPTKASKCNKGRITRGVAFGMMLQLWAKFKAEIPGWSNADLTGLQKRLVDAFEEAMATHPEHAGSAAAEDEAVPEEAEAEADAETEAEVEPNFG